jgi:hypothetical protein
MAIEDRTSLRGHFRGMLTTSQRPCGHMRQHESLGPSKYNSPRELNQNFSTIALRDRPALALIGFTATIRYGNLSKRR